jgi:two-component system, OmpR family, alkaline phosphatase synthesis response regulator PhoP
MKTEVKKKVLVADDELSIRALVKQCLGNYEVIEAEDGEQALKMAQLWKPDLILLDIMMPKMDGYTVCHRLRTESANKAVPIVMITGVGFELNAKLSLSLGANAYIIKPFNINTLVDTVEKLLK